MSRSSATFSVSLPPEMAEELERARRNEHRTRSEFVREALRQYMERGDDLRRMRQRIADLPEEEATAEEVEAIAEGLQEFREGKFIPLKALRNDMDRRPRESRRTKSQTHSRR
jgi:Arc/MetJ-type ribon-helix-helix transcriptional regulator